MTGSVVDSPFLTWCANSGAARRQTKSDHGTSVDGQSATHQDLREQSFVGREYERRVTSA